MGQCKRIWLVPTALILALAFLVQSAPAKAQTSEYVVDYYGSGAVYDPSRELPRPTTFERAFTKLGRGVSNILLGWAEIPVAFDRGVKRGKPLGYLLGVAPVLGTARAVMRTSTGVFEMVTFPFSDRDVNYEAVLEPEYIF